MAIFTRVMTGFWVKIPPKSIPGGLTQWRKPYIGLVFWENLLKDSLQNKFKFFSNTAIFTQVMTVFWVKIAQKSIPGGLTQWKKPCIGLVFWENLLIDSLQNKFKFFSNMAIFTRVMTVFWVKIAQKFIPGGLTQWRKPCIGLVFWENLTDSLQNKFKFFSNSAIFIRIMTVFWVKIAPKSIPGGLTQWKKPWIGLVFWENFLMDSLQNKFNFLSNMDIFTRVMSVFWVKNSSKVHSRRPNTMKETLHWPDVVGKPSFT